MKKFVKLSIAVSLMIGVPIGVRPKASQNVDRPSCSVIEQGLRDYEQLKSAHNRREVLKHFTPEGGMQFPANTRYVDPKCEYLHVDVQFELIKPAEVAALPDDKVIGVSKLYVDYPAKD